MKMIALGECCEIVSGATPSSSVPEFWGGDIDWATPADLSQLSGAYIDSTPRKLTAAGLASCSAKLLPVGSVLLSSRAPIGHVAINTIPMATNQGFKSLMPDSDVLDPKYLYHWLRGSKAYLQSLGNGATFKELSKSTVARVKIPVPTLDEQRRIATILDRAGALSMNRAAVVGRLEDLAQSVFRDMFGGGPQRLLPLADLCVRITDGTHQSPEWAKEGHPFLFVSNITSGEINFTTSKFISGDTHAELTARCPIEVGDVLYSTVGSYGVPVVVRSERKFAFQRHIAHLKPRRELIHPEFLAAQLAAPEVKRQADVAARGAAQKTVNLKDIKAFSVFAPPMAQQLDFVRRLGAIRAARLGALRSHEALSQLEDCLQAAAVSGRL
ncbi:restriction endonuclease subunit S [Blastococcus sp. TF02A_35]|uniref:restriction endonuclease subunit S n=1 Tax=Blastococcus sp. TF02A-35 TaxID=2559612 RepID=UPI001073F3E7|nr:restriction endonuclease subunit S [Blastococcus sp. TF02A_35]TFV52860.1 restriction endonuclease subunit S [Blastococcus sp. TF02A_35]